MAGRSLDDEVAAKRHELEALDNWLLERKKEMEKKFYGQSINDVITNLEKQYSALGEKHAAAEAEIKKLRASEGKLKTSLEEEQRKTQTLEEEKASAREKLLKRHESELKDKDALIASLRTERDDAVDLMRKDREEVIVLQQMLQNYSKSLKSQARTLELATSALKQSSATDQQGLEHVVAALFEQCQKQLDVLRSSTRKMDESLQLSLNYRALGTFLKKRQGDEHEKEGEKVEGKEEHSGTEKLVHSRGASEASSGTCPPGERKQQLLGTTSKVRPKEAAQRSNTSTAVIGTLRTKRVVGTSDGGDEACDGGSDGISVDGDVGVVLDESYVVGEEIGDDDISLSVPKQHRVDIPMVRIDGEDETGDSNSGGGGIKADGAMFKRISRIESLRHVEATQLSRRNEVVNEILITEKTYVKSLRVVIDHFLVPMQERIGDLFQEQDVKELFCNIDTLWEVNSMFLASLEREDVHFEMGKIFLKTVNFFKMYQVYVNNYHKALTTLARLQKSKSTGLFISERNGSLSAEYSVFDIAALLILPVQRIPRYSLLLQQLCECTPQDHPDYDTLQEAKVAVENIAEGINDTKRAHEKLDPLVQLQNSMSGDFPMLVRPTRALVHDGELKMTFGSSLTVRQNHCFLFNDLLLYARPKRNKFSLVEGQYHCEGYVALSEAALINAKGGEHEHSFTLCVSSSSSEIHFHAPSAEGKKKWMQLLRRYICVETKKVKEQQAVLKKSGYLEKKGHIRKNWKLRWFVLDKMSLSYFTSHLDGKMLGSIKLAGYTVEEQRSEQRLYVLRLHAPGRKEFLLCADCEHEFREWVDVLRDASTVLSSEP